MESSGISTPPTNRPIKPATLAVLVVVGLLVPMIIALDINSCSHVSSSSASRESPEQILSKQLQQNLNDNKQMIFDAFHPMGTASSVTVHDVSIVWKSGHSITSWDDMQQYTVRFTLYWKSPLHDDGYTKIAATFDNESKRYTASEILATNGMTKQDVGNVLGQVLVGVASAALSP